MLKGSPVTTILPVVDVQRAQRFYEEKLGLGPGRAGGNGDVVFESAGALLALSPRPEPTTATHTALSFEVDDVAREVRELEGRGVRFEDYDLPGLKTVEHVCVLGAERAAWFKDTEGNILCVHDQVKRR
jgi:catechol 2,3-dioxygenase-like lactoylglutathione lyase family enzyme